MAEERVSTFSNPARSKASLLFYTGLVLAVAVSGVMVVYWQETKTLLKNSCYIVATDNICDAEFLRAMIGGYLFGALALPLALLIERMAPAKPDQSLFSVGLKQDIVWFLIGKIFKLTFIAGFSLLLYALYDNYLSFTRLDVVGSLPVAAQIVFVILLSDFIGWMHHWVRHKVPIFWQFHKIHHSQREMNYFCDSRIHPGDSIIARVVGFIPFYSLELETAIPTYVAWEIFSTWYTNFNHANIRANYGFLRYFMVTPQSHRIHHSIEPEHRDMNFAVMFSIWDFIFKTQHLGFDDYPDTGVEDEKFPVETDGRPTALIGSTVRQLIYPFKFLIPGRKA